MYIQMWTDPDVKLDVDIGVELDALAPDVNPPKRDVGLDVDPNVNLPNIESEERGPLTGIEKGEADGVVP